jgi:hypothetical protein
MEEPMKRYFYLSLIAILLLSSCILFLTDLSTVEILVVSFLDEETLILMLDHLPEEYYIMVEEEEYACQLEPGTDELWECIGPAFNPGMDVKLSSSRRKEIQNPCMKSALRCQTAQK